MRTHSVTKDGLIYVECLPDGSLLDGEDDALDLVAACGEAGTHRLLIHSESLPEDFYRLASGLAGKVLLKFGNYAIRWAAVIPHELAHKGRFGQMVREANRGNDFRVFAEREHAEAWLLRE